MYEICFTVFISRVILYLFVILFVSQNDKITTKMIKVTTSRDLPNKLKLSGLFLTFWAKIFRTYEIGTKQRDLEKK